MANFEPKKMALIRTWDILKYYSDYNHPLTQKDIQNYLKKDYGISIERKAVSRNLSLLREMGVEIESSRKGSYIEIRDFEDSELHMLIDGVLSSKHISAVHSKNLIEKLCGLSSKYFRSCVKNVTSVNEWSKTDNQALFYNIELVDEAISKGRQIKYDYNKYDIDKKLHKTSTQHLSPYQLILHNQRYYLMGYNDYWKNIVYHRMDHITNMEVLDDKATPLRSLKGFENGIDYKLLSTAMPYMYADKPVRVTFEATVNIIDQIVDWFGDEAKISKVRDDDSKVKVVIKASPLAMEHWAMQYANFVEIISPKSLRESVKKSLKEAIKKY
ncbi:MAG: WYL domain-containing protein [Eubacterium sp.]|nr:WYL domain-containing protein [Eubacterium sp.]